MNSKRSIWKLFVGVAGIGLLVTNCTIKTESDDGCTPGKKLSGCICAGNVASYQVCSDDAVYGACVCDANSNGGASGTAGTSSTAGTSNTAGTSSTAGAAGATSAAGESGATASGGSAGDATSEAGAGGESAVGATECYSCLIDNCSDEWDACAAESETTTTDPDGHYCLSEGTNAAPGQIELIISCITSQRAKGVAKRDAVRACGSTIGQSADPTFFEWPPSDGSMTPATEGLINCMADKADEVANPGAWATDSTNFPSSGPRPWDDMTCAKLACTSSEL